MIPVNMWPHGNTVAADRPCVRRDGVDCPAVCRAAAGRRCRVREVLERAQSSGCGEGGADHRRLGGRVRRCARAARARAQLFSGREAGQHPPPAAHVAGRVLLRPGRAAGLRSGAQVPGPLPAARRRDDARDRRAPHRRRPRRTRFGARRRRADLRPADRVARRAVVEQGADREPRRNPRQHQADLQRRREPRRARRRVGRRHRAVLRRDARYHAVRELPAP